MRTFSAISESDRLGCAADGGSDGGEDQERPLAADACRARARPRVAQSREALGSHRDQHTHDQQSGERNRIERPAPANRWPSCSCRARCRPRVGAVGRIAECQGSVDRRERSALPSALGGSALPGQLGVSPHVLFARVRQVAFEVLECGVADETLHSSGYGALGLLGAALSWPGPLDRGKRPQGYALGDRAWRHVDPTTRLTRTIKDHLAEALGEPFSSERCHVIHEASAHALSVAFHDSRTRTVSNGARSACGGSGWCSARVKRSVSARCCSRHRPRTGSRSSTRN